MSSLGSLLHGSARLARAARTAAALAALLTSGASRIDAQILFRLTPSAGELGTELRADQWGFIGDPRARQANQQYWLRLPFSGALFNTRVFNYSLVVRPQWGRQTLADQPVAFANRRVGFDFGASLFDGLPVGVLYNVTRNSGSIGGVGQTTDQYGTSSHGGTVRIDARPFPMRIRFLTRASNDLVELGTTLDRTRRDERLRTVEITGQSSKLMLNVNRMAFTDNIGALSFSSLDGEIAHTRRWGRASSLQTTFGSNSREGNSQYRRWTWSERVQVRHSDEANSNLYVQGHTGSVEGVRLSNTSLGMGTRYQVGRWLGVSLDASRLTSAYQQGSLHASTVAPRLTYSARLPLGAVISGGAAGMLERERRDVAGGTELPVTDERHRVAEASRPITLRFANADSASVVVHSADYTFAFVRNLDFRLVRVGEELQLYVIPLSRIKTGDELLVSYRYSVVGGRERSTIGRSFDANLSLRWLSVRHAVSQRSISSPDDPSAALTGGTDQSTIIGLQRATRLGTLDVQLERRTRTVSMASHHLEEVRVTVLPVAGPTIQTSFAVLANRGNDIGRSNSLVSARGTVNWLATSNARFQGSLESWQWIYADAVSDRILGATTELNLQLGRIETEWRYAYQQRTRSRTGMQHRLSTRVVRRF